MLNSILSSPQKPYYPLSQYYRELFNHKVFKVSVSVADTCPNRKNKKGKPTCIFCDEWGSAAYHQFADKSLEEQILINREAIRKRYKAEKFLIYFQAYTNTFGHVNHLEQMYNIALSHKDIIGVILGTRPDCLPRGVLQTLKKISQESFISVELGLQTLDDEQLKFLSRGHDRQCSLDAINKLKQLENVNICAHLMFGLPSETDEQLIETATILSKLGIHGVKLHNLHVLKNTPLESLYRSNVFTPVTLEEYTRKVGIFLEYLSPEVAVHRLVAVASRWDELIAPEWTKKKMEPTQYIENYLVSQNIWQGKKLLTNTLN